MKKYFIYCLIFIFFFNYKNSNANEVEKTEEDNKDTFFIKTKNGNIYFLPFFLIRTIDEPSIFGISLYFNTTIKEKFNFGSGVSIGSSNYFRSFDYRSIKFLFVYDINTKSYISTNVYFNFNNRNKVSTEENVIYDNFLFSVGQSYTYKITNRLYYNIGFDYYYSYFFADIERKIKNTISERFTYQNKSNTVRLFTGLEYDLGKLLSKKSHFLIFRIGSRLFYDIFNSAGLSTNSLYFNSIKFETGKAFNDSFGILFYLTFGLGG